MAKIHITDTILRDAHQSLAATRMRIEDMLPMAEKLDKVGYWSLEAWGGATFDSCLRFLNEDPWVRLRKLKEALPNTKIQMLLRGQNLLGYKHYADDVVDLFIKKAHENGVEVFRIFDALNDLRNIEQSVKSVKKHGGIVEACFSYTTSPIHTNEYFVNMAIEMEKMGADTICIKDMANLLLPYTAYELVRQLKQAVNLPIHVHTHNTSGTGEMIYLKAIEAGADIVDTALSSMANGTSQPATEPLVATLAGTEYDTGLDLGLITEISEYFKKVAAELKDEGFLKDKAKELDIRALQYQVPGGMLSNLMSQLEQQKASDKYYEVLEEVPRVRADFGYPPLVTPSSQIVGTQAVLNVLAGERYKIVTNESKGMLKGEYGKLPGDVDPELRKKIIGDAPVIEHRPADTIAPELDKYREEAKEYAKCDEDVLSWALFPQVAEKFFKARKAEELKLDENILDREKNIHPVV
ncbi:MAG: oxaloacetate decarboxylase subunit alpha [Clostridiales bacterium]|nr:oxaloacetate decarboxylase subunit alpha [Clostridiales bacterium]